MEHNPNFNVAFKHLAEYRTARKHSAELWQQHAMVLKKIKNNELNDVNELRKINNDIAKIERILTETAESFAYHYDEAAKQPNK